MLDFNEAPVQIAPPGAVWGPLPGRGRESSERDTRIKQVASESLASPLPILEELLPGGKLIGREYTCGDLSGGPGESCKVNINTGKWSDFAGGKKEQGGDLVSLVATVRACTQSEAAEWLSQRCGHMPALPTQKNLSVAQIWRPITPVPGAAAPIPENHPVHGKPSSVWEYRNQMNQLLGCVMRFDSPGGKKQVLPVTYCTNGNKQEWRWQALPEPRPLYGLELLKDSKKVLIVEGEKAADAARRMLGGDVPVLTWPGGSNAPGKADWRPLSGKAVTIWPDADEPGTKAAEVIADRLKSLGCNVRVLVPPAGVVKGWDAADAEAEGMTGEQLQAVIAQVWEAQRDRLFVSVADQADQATSIDYLIHGVVENNTTNATFGPSGSGKSFFVFDLACHIVTGREWNGNKVVRPGAVLVLAGEGRRGIIRRIKAWCQHHGVEMSELRNLYISKHTLLMDGSSTSLICQDMDGADVVMVVVDTLARHLVGDENSTADMTSFIQQVDQLRDRLGASAMVVHHSGHAEAQRSRGNSSFKAALDSEILCRDGLLTWTKTKDMEPPEPIKFKLVPVEIGTDEEGQPITSCVVEYGEQSQRHQGQKLNAHEKHALQALIAVCVTENRKNAGGQYVGSVEAWRDEFYRLRRIEEPDAKQTALRKAFQRVRGTGIEGGGLKDKGLIAYTDDGVVLLRLDDQAAVNFALLSQSVTRDDTVTTEGQVTGGKRDEIAGQQHPYKGCCPVVTPPHVGPPKQGSVESKNVPPDTLAELDQFINPAGGAA